jgi:hypothetical protein
MMDLIVAGSMIEEPVPVKTGSGGDVGVLAGVRT